MTQPNPEPKEAPSVPPEATPPPIDLSGAVDPVAYVKHQQMTAELYGLREPAKIPDPSLYMGRAKTCAVDFYRRPPSNEIIFECHVEDRLLATGTLPGDQEEWVKERLEIDMQTIQNMYGLTSAEVEPASKIPGEPAKPQYVCPVESCDFETDSLDDYKGHFMNEHSTMMMRNPRLRRGF